VELRASRRRVFRLSSEIGEEGVRLGRPAPFELGERIEVCLAVPEGEPFVLRATVEAVDDEEEQGGRGLRFIEVPMDIRRVIRGYVAQRLGLPLSPQ
jgi:PilZ domain-containing protein